MAELPLSYYWFLLMRHRWRIVTFVLVTTVIVSMMTLALPKQYESSVLMRVDPQGRNVVGDNESQGNVNVDATLLVATEAQVITSPAVVSELIQRLDLAHNPEFAPKDIASPVLTQAQTDRILKNVTKAISVNQPIGTMLLKISFRCHDPKLAAEAANGLAQAFIDHEYATRARALKDSSKYMTDQLDNLRAQMERAQAALVDYQSNHDVVDPDDNNNIYQARLREINTDLTSAESARMKLQADEEIVKSGNLDALMATPRGQGILPIWQRLQSDQRTLGRMSSIYGVNHPLYRQQKALVAYDQGMLKREQQHISRQVDSQYHAALLREQLIRSALSQEKSAVDEFNMRTIRYHALKASADSATKLYYDIQQRIQDETVASGLHSEDLRVVSNAQPSSHPVFPRPLLSAFLALFGSTLIGIAAVIVSGLMDKTVSTPEQIELRFHARVIASLPLVGERDGTDDLSVGPYALSGQSVPNKTDSRGTQALQRRSAFQESILGLHSAIQFSAAGAIHVLALTSSIPGEGKSTISCHLANAFSSLGVRTILVDADMRKPNVHRIFRVPNRHGLSSVLHRKLTIDEAVQNSHEGPALLTSGPLPANPAELLHLGMPDLVEQLRHRYDVILIDCPPVLGFADAANIANIADATLLVVSAGSTEQNQISAALRQLRGVRANLMGTILNRVSEKLDTYYNYYKDSYKAYYQNAGDDEDLED